MAVDEKEIIRSARREQKFTHGDAEARTQIDLVAVLELPAALPQKFVNSRARPRFGCHGRTIKNSCILAEMEPATYRIFPPEVSPQGARGLPLGQRQERRFIASPPLLLI